MKLFLKNAKLRLIWALNFFIQLSNRIKKKIESNLMKIKPKSERTP